MSNSTCDVCGACLNRHDGSVCEELSNLRSNQASQEELLCLLAQAVLAGKETLTESELRLLKRAAGDLVDGAT